MLTDLNSKKGTGPDFETIINDDEEMLWIGRPKFVPYIISGLSYGVAAILFFVVYFIMEKSVKFDNFKMANYFFLAAFIPLAIFLLQFLYKILSFSNIRYGYTNKRIMIRSGFPGINFKAIDYDKISEIEITVNIVERIFGIGTIRFDTGKTQREDGFITKLHDRWEAIENPYEVFKKIKEVAVDIKTDFSYPNALRPESNPGYTTKYRRDRTN